MSAKTTFNTGGSFSRNLVANQLLLTGFSGDGQTQQGEFRFTRLSYAAYASVQSTIAGIDIKPSLRIEYFDQDLRDENDEISGFQNALRLLPSLHLSKKITDQDSLRASYSVRLEKPDATNLNPLLRYNSQFQADQGNPFLRPITKNQFEIMHTHQVSNLFLTQSFYYRTSKNDVNSYFFTGDDG